MANPIRSNPATPQEQQQQQQQLLLLQRDTTAGYNWQGRLHKLWINRYNMDVMLNGCGIVVVSYCFIEKLLITISTTISIENMNSCGFILFQTIMDPESGGVRGSFVGLVQNG